MHRAIQGAIAVSTMAAFLLLHCVSLNQVAGGSSSETVIGKVAHEDGTPACSTIEILYPANYDPVSNASLPRSMTDTTDRWGMYSVNVSDSMVRYSIVAIHPGSETRSLVSEIVLDSDTTRVRDAVLSKPGAIMVAVPDSADMVNGYCYIPGTGIAVFINSGGLILLDHVPAGTIPTINYASKTAPGVSIVLISDVNVLSADTVVIPFPQWRYSRRLYLNTSASGASVFGDVAGFPVLVRLNPGNFDFSQAQGSGGDIRFTKSDNTFLPYEIERWDAAAQQAEIWVRIDTVRGNDSTQSIRMYWGNPEATDLSNSTAVFDTAAGFQGAWHLTESGNTTAFDATANHYDGTPSGMSAASTVDGMIGNARSFNGTSSYIALTGTAQSKLSLPENGNYTLSAWVVASAIDSAAHYIISKSNRNYNLDLSGKNLWEIYDLRSAVGWESNFAVAQSGEWKYLTGVRSGSVMRLYVDGVCADSTIDTTASSSRRDSTFDVQIGKRAESEYGFWNGVIDEVNISNMSRSADWIKLCYMNQKKDNRLITFK